MSILINRARYLGLAIGSVWLIAAGGAFAAVSLAMIGTPGAWAAFIGTLAAAAVLLSLGVSVVRTAWRLPREGAPSGLDAHLIGRRFAVVVGAEVIALAVVNPVAAATGHFALLTSLNLGIVGVHFLPLAWLFRVPRYYLMGLLFCAIPVATLLSMSSNAVVGHALAWYVVPSLGCGMVASLTGAAGLREVWFAVAGARASWAAAS